MTVTNVIVVTTIVIAEILSSLMVSFREDVATIGIDIQSSLGISQDFLKAAALHQPASEGFRKLPSSGCSALAP